MKLENPMKIQRVAAEPPPPREQREPRGDRRGGGDGGDRRGGGGGDRRGPPRPRASVSDSDTKPRTFGGGRLPSCPSCVKFAVVNVVTSDVRAIDVILY